MSDSASLGIFNLELIVGRMRKRRLIFGIFSLAHSHRRPHKWVIARLWPELMIPGAYRLDCRVSFLRIQPDLCKFVLSATHLVTAVANRTNIDNIDIFLSASNSLIAFLFKHIFISHHTDIVTSGILSRNIDFVTT